MFPTSRTPPIHFKNPFVTEEAKQKSTWTREKTRVCGIQVLIADRAWSRVRHSAPLFTGDSPMATIPNRIQRNVMLFRKAWQTSRTQDIIRSPCPTIRVGTINCLPTLWIRLIYSLVLELLVSTSTFNHWFRFSRRIHGWVMLIVICTQGICNILPIV